MLIALFLAGYTFIALCFIACSLYEGERSGGGWDFYRLLGLLLCVVWPATIVTIMIVLRQEREIG